MKKRKTQNDRGEAALRKMLSGEKRSEEAKAILPKARRYVLEHRNELECCPFCNRNIKDREESIYLELMVTLFKVYEWCRYKGKHEFTMKDIRHLMGPVNYSRFGNLDHYGGIIYKTEKQNGHFGMNLERAGEFFRGERDIPLKRMVSKVTGETVAETRGFAKDLPKLKDYLDEHGDYINASPAAPEVIVPSKRGLPTVEETQQKLL